MSVSRASVPLRKVACKEPRTSQVVRGLKIKLTRPVPKVTGSMSRSMVWMVSSRQQETSVMVSQRRAYSSSSSPLMQAQQSKSAYKLDAYGASIPHPDKVEKGGEDAFFVANDGGAAGVFDGVGGWSEMGIDPGIYSESLAAESNAAYEQLGGQNPVNLLEKAWLNSQHIQGSSTACCVTLEGDVLRGANLGDSGFIVVREGKLLHRQKEQQHGFNFPFQLGGGSTDSPMDADCVEIPIQQGDVVVLATDGVLDNVFDEDLVGIVGQGMELGKSEAEIAQRVASVASAKANSSTIRSPFGEAAGRAGYNYNGGKLDDITVVVAIVRENGVGAKL